MECIDEHRSFWDFIPKYKMPKAFLMSGKRHNGEDEENMSEADESSSSEREESNLSPEYKQHDDSDSVSARNSPVIYPSAGSAFCKIGKSESEQGAGPSKSPLNATPMMTGFYPGFYTPFYSSHFFPSSSESGTPTFSGSAICQSSFMHQNGSPKSKDTNLPDSSDKNIFYYADPRIPFTNYFLNLTKLLTGTSKEYTATTPLGKMAGEDRRSDDREPTISPDSTKSISGKPRAETITSSESDHSGPENMDESFEKKAYQPDSVPDKLNIPAHTDPRFINPFTGSFMQPMPHGTVLPVPGSGLFHPALMHMPGSAYRRYNPEKPPPVKKYKCDVCGKAFSRSNTLVTHKRIHTGDKPFKCEICSRAFRQPGNLTRHRLTHTTVKPYVCPTCNKAFNRASNLHTHMRTHTSFKAYVCPYCGKGFHQKIDMKIHCYTHTAHAARPEASPL